MPELWETLATEHGERTAVIDTHHHPATELTYSELHDAICIMGRGLQRLGLGCARRAHMHVNPHKSELLWMLWCILPRHADRR